MTDDDLRGAEEAERLGDAAEARQAAAALYQEAQRLLLPAGVVWTDRAAYDRRMEAFERIQQKLYGLQTRGSATPPEVQAIVAATNPIVAPPYVVGDVSVGEFTAGMAVRVAQDFTDYDGQQIHAGEVLHFLDSSYFPYESGHTLLFEEKTIRLAGIVDEHEPIIANEGNAWFQPLTESGISEALSKQRLEDT